MRKDLVLAGMLLGAALVFAAPSKADSVSVGWGDHWVDTQFGNHSYELKPQLLAFGHDRPTGDWDGRDGREGTIEFRAWDFDWQHHHGLDRDSDTTTTTVSDPPDPTASTPEPLSLALIGIGGLALAGLRRRKSA